MSTPALPKVLFVTYGGGHVSMVIPVAQQLVAERRAEPVVMALTIAGAACERAGIPSVGFKDFVRAGEDDEALRVGRQLTSDSVSHPDIDAAESVAYHGFSYLDLVNRHGAEKAAQLYRQDGRRAFLPLTFLERVIETVAPAVVVATNSPRAERAAIEVASAARIPSCCLVDAFGRQEKWVSAPHYADRVCVLTPAVREMLIESGRSPAEVLVTGNPAFDALASVVESRSSRETGGAFRILWAAHHEPGSHPISGLPSPNPDLPERIEAELRRCAFDHPDWEIVIRPHPTMVGYEIEGPPNLNVVAGDELEARLSWADVVVTVASTVAIQAAFVRIPVIAIAGSVISADVTFVEDGLAQGADVGSLEAALQRVRADSEPVNVDLPTPGGATKRVIDVILSLI